MSAVFPTSLDITTFKSLYPEYNQALLSDAILNDMWLSVGNISPAFISNYAQNIANSYWFKVLAHYCQLRLTRQAGRVTAGSQGDTSTTLEGMPIGSAGSLQWWNQTVWGSEIAQLIRRRGGITYFV